MQKNIFKKTSIDQITSPEQLNDYIKISNPSVWLIIASILIFLISSLIWGFFGSMSTSVTLKGVFTSGNIVCFSDPSSEINYSAGMKASIINNDGSTVTGHVSEVASTPLSYTEASSGISNDYAIYALSLTDWNTMININIDNVSLIENAVYTVTITIESIRPISLILG